MNYLITDINMEMSQETNNLNVLPFYNLNEPKFTSLSNSLTKCLDHNSDLHNLLPNPQIISHSIFTNNSTSVRMSFL